jgi:ParB/RepB/Spo0J family partition protein
MRSMSTATDTATITTLPADQIHAGTNDRKTFDHVELVELAASISELGCIQPPTVRPDPRGGFELVAGERRYRAMSEILGWTMIPAHVVTMDDRTASRAMLAENTARTDLDPIAEADAFQRRIDEYSLTQAEVAEWAGVKVSRVSARLRLLRLIPAVRHLIATGNMAPERGVAMSVLDANRQQYCIDAMAQSPLTVGELRQLVDRLKGEQDAEPLFDPDSFFQIEEYVIGAKAAGLGKLAVRKLCAQMAAVLEANGLAPEMVAAVKALKVAA